MTEPPRATAVMATKVVKGPISTGLEPATVVWVSYHPDCGCAWGWCLDRTGINPDLGRPRLKRADDAEAELAHTGHHHTTGAAFHVAHRP